MIDLNFLYTFATNNNEEKEVREDYYLKAQALVNESKQNFALYYEGVLSERIYKCVDNAHSELTSIDLFILLLDEFGFEVTDFLDAIKNYNFEQKNVVDKYFYDFAPNLRIFSAFNEIRIRNNWALFSDAKTGEKLPQNVISNENFLFKHPIKFLGDGWLKDVFYSMLKEDAEDAFMTDAKVATLLAPFYLKNSLYFDIDSLPTFIKNNIHIVKDYCDEFRSKENLENAINKRNSLYVEIYNNYFSRNFWSYQDNFLDGLVSIDENGEAIYRYDVENAKMMSVQQVEKERQRIAKICTKNNKKNQRFVVNKEQCEHFKSQIIGQDEAIENIVDKLISVSCGFYSNDKPIATLLLNGPTGVGKTQTAKSLANTFFDGKIYCVDMTNFKNEGDVSMLIGSSPGYVGYGDKNAFVEFIKSNPSCVLLFDEIDKASPSCLPFMMRLLDEGKFSTAKGETIDVSKCVIVATTNQTVNVSKNRANKNLEELSSKSGEKGSPFLKEFVGRFDSILNYNELSVEDLKGILRQKIDETIKNYNSKPESILSIDYGEKLLDDILLEANAIETGARALNKCVQDLFVRSITRYWVEHINDNIAEICVVDKNHLLVDGKEVVINNAKSETQKTKFKENDLVYFG